MLPQPALHLRPNFLQVVPRGQWREPSLAQPRDQFGRQNRTRFVIELWKREGSLVSRRWFEDRAEFDFELERIIIHEPFEDIVPLWATVEVLTSPTGSNQTWNRPVDWNDAVNTIEAIGAGGQGGRSSVAGTALHNTGGGGAAWALVNNFVADATETYQIASAIAQASGTEDDVDGSAGGDSWFGATTFGASAVGAKGGLGGAANVAGSINGPAGGQAASCIGDSKNDGGDGGDLTGASGSGASGGGGAGGPSGQGFPGTSSSSTSNVATAGGDGNNNAAGSGQGGAGSTAGNGSNGTSGTDLAAGAAGTGGGGGGTSRGAAAASSGAGGSYGAASGAAALGGGNTATVRASGQGIIIITYTPAVGHPYVKRVGGIPGMGRGNLGRSVW